MSGDDGLVTELEEFFSAAYVPAIALLKKEFPKRRSLIVDFVELEKWNADLADLLLMQPDKVIPAAKEALGRCGIVKVYDYEPHVRFANLPNTELLVQDIGSAHIDRLIRIEGVVTKRVETKPKVKMAMYKCSNCGATYKVEITKSSKPMAMCEVCKKKIDFAEEESYFVDMQMAEMQELLERLKGGAPASNIQLMIEDDLVNTYNPGDNLIINGILRIRLPPQKAKMENVYLKYIDVVCIEKMQKDFEQLEISEEEEALIKEMAKDPNILKKIAASVAPGIYGHEKIKEAISLQLFGGTKNKMLPGGAPVRNDVHLLLIGDPGAAKSRLLQYVADVAPKSVYVSGKSVSGVGLTASAEKDELGDGGWVLKAGALVLASGGIACIDEFDKIDDRERAALHEAMEMQTVSVAKAGIVARFRTKTAIIAAANPKFGRFNPNQYPADQFDIPPTLLSRFDLIFPIFDVLDEEKDRELARHILEPHAGIKSEKRVFEDYIEKDLLRKYIAYARRNINPTLTRDAMERISEYYVEMRKLGRREGSVPITPRQIEGLIRLSEAAAKSRLSNSVEMEDTGKAIKLFDFALKQIAMDAATGKLDIDIIATGQPKARTERFALILNIIKDLSTKYDMIDINEIKSAAREFNIDDNEANRIVEQLLDKGEVYRPKHGFVKLLDKKG